MTATYALTETLLAIEHVSLMLGSRVILRDVNAQVQEIDRPGCVTGQVIAFLGPSGIGKTQLCRVLVGLQAPTVGQVTLAGGRPVRKGDVGLVPQAYPLFEFATVWDNLRIAGRHDPHWQGTATALLAEFDLQPYARMYPSRLSGGTRQRVAIVRQLMCAGHYLVLDEPFSGLDPVMKGKAAALVAQVANRDARNVTIVVTHDVTEGCGVADAVWLMGREPGQPGARLVEQYDLAERDLCWHPDLQREPRFQAFVGEVKARFRSLA